MALLLHLTDLHLSQPRMEDAIGDYRKVNVLTEEQYQTRTGRINSTIEALGSYLEAKNAKLDAVVISGDITNGGRPEGFALLPTLLKKLKGALPDPDRILITPGNHDVQWNTPPGSPERYEHLVALRNKEQYRTCYLDGIDIDSAGMVTGNALTPLLEASDGSFIVVPVNSANSCGTVSAVEAELESHLDDIRNEALSRPAIAQLLSAWTRRGLFDVARVDDSHLAAAGRLFARFPRQGRFDEPLRIAALHHPIAPVTGIEEFKPFETLTNLGHFREWIRSHHIDLVLHGHTHVSRLSHDSHTAFGTDAKADSHRFVVASGGTIGLGGPVPGPIGRLFETTGEAPRIRPIRVAEIHTTDTKATLDDDDVAFRPVSIHFGDQQAAGVVSGKTIDDVFEQLMGLGDFAHVALPLVCRVVEGATAHSLPRNYPDMRVPVEDRPAWLDATISWWQGADKGQSAAFNHGERLRKYGPDALDQVQRAGETLANKPGSSRAVAVLLRPESDLSEDKLYPAFVFLQATVRKNKLDLVAYFRKQEMPHWWPVNMAELATIQDELLAQVKKRHSQVSAGSITSITAMPGAGDGVPDVLIPWLDLHSDYPARIVGIITPLVVAHADIARDTWGQAFRDWVPAEGLPLDADPVPTVGLKILVGLLSALRDVFPEAAQSAVDDLSRALNNIYRANVHYKDGMNLDARPELRTAWRNDLHGELAHMNGAIEAILKSRTVADRSYVLTPHGGDD